VPQPRPFDAQFDRQVPVASDPPPDLRGRLALGEAARPGGEEAVPAELAELPQDRDDGVVSGLEREIVQVTPGRVAQ
jgi:hypothetical protein